MRKYNQQQQDNVYQELWIIIEVSLQSVWISSRITPSKSQEMNGMKRDKKKKPKKNLNNFLKIASVCLWHEIKNSLIKWTKKVKQGKCFQKIFQ